MKTFTWTITALILVATASCAVVQGQQVSNACSNDVCIECTGYARCDAAICDCPNGQIVQCDGIVSSDTCISSSQQNGTGTVDGVPGTQTPRPEFTGVPNVPGLGATPGPGPNAPSNDFWCSFSLPFLC